MLVARCDLGDLTSALVVAYNSRKDEHCLRFADGEVMRGAPFSAFWLHQFLSDSVMGVIYHA